MNLIVVYIFSFIFTTLAYIRLLLSVFTKGLKVFRSPKWHPMPQMVYDEKYGVHKMAHLKNVNLHYVESGNENAQLMVFLHGFPEFWFSWRHQILKFQEKYRVVAVDLRGYGGSDKPQDITSYKKKALVEDIVQLIEFLGSKNCILVAHDWGGIIAWSLAATRPDIIKKLIVMNAPHHNAFVEVLETNRKQLLKSWYVFHFQMPCIPEWMFSRNDYDRIEDIFNGKLVGMKTKKFSTQEMEAYKASMGQPGALRAAINYYRAVMQYPSTPSRDQITVPALLLWGTADGAITMEAAEATKKYCDNLTLIYHDGISHWVQQEDPITVNANMEKFLSE